MEKQWSVRCLDFKKVSLLSLQMRVYASSLPVQGETVYLTAEVHDVETHLQYVTDENGEAHFSLDTTNWNNTLVSIRVS